jgi:hypothetical protein
MHALLKRCVGQLNSNALCTAPEVGGLGPKHVAD